ncbi:MAG: hypothetical protein JNM80_14100 [Phycisphaerae bacterium]|nr:hypothetical protein [Phycisphaerae bacterium]
MTWNSSGVTTSASYALPTDVLFTQVAAGNGFSYGLTENGEIVAVGTNTFGQVSGAPTSIGWSAVAAGYDHGLALRNDGTLHAWGRNQYGQGSVPTDSYAIENNLTYTAIAAGEYFNLALRSDGTIFHFGDDSRGKDDIPNNTPGQYVAIAFGGHHAVAKTAAGRVKAWGGLDYPANECAGSVYTEWTHPGSVPSALSDVAVLEVGAGHTVTYVITASGRTVYAWGCGLGVQGTPVVLGTPPVGQGYYNVGVANGVTITGMYGAGLLFTLDSTIVQWGRVDASGTPFSDPPNNIPSELADDKFIAIGKGHSNLHGVAIRAP